MREKFVYMVALYLLLWCPGCKNAKSRSSEFSDCSVLTSMKASSDGDWLFSIKHPIVIKNNTRPNVEINLLKSSKGKGERQEAIIMAISIDSAICIDKDGYIYFIFTDSSNLAFPNYFDNNCFGYLQTSFGKPLESDSERNVGQKISKMLNAKVCGITLGTHNGYRDYTLSAEDGANLQQLFNCIYKAK